ncbi:MAG: ATPase [Limnothrix sp. RL_2_0]|nr:ATPase [Limnothrix sp. RL_2_0]
MNTPAHATNSSAEAQETILEQRHWEADLKLIVEGIASQIGEEFFRACVQYLAELLQVKYAFIAEFIDGEEPRANVLAFWAGDDFGPNFEYPLAGTPCGIVLDTGLQIYHSGIQQAFPEDLDLVTLKAESYLGIAIVDSQGKIIGHIAGLHTQPLNRSYEEQEAILKIFAARSAAEIERQITEQALKQQNQRLEETLMQLQRTQAQLIQAEKMSSLGHMVAGIAHEINNPISFIEGNLVHADQYYDNLLKIIELYQQAYPHPSEVMQQDIKSLELEFIQIDSKKIIQSMQVGSQRIIEIVKTCRNFSRLDESIFKVVDLHEGLEGALMILKNRIHSSDGNSSIKIVREYGKIPHIYCSPAQLNQVFLNLLNNAIDTLEEANKKCVSEAIVNKHNTIRIRTYLNPETDDQNQVVIAIADNGLGILDEMRSKIFDPFFTTKAVGKGTGLGLSVSYQIINNLHGGTLSCASTVGKGTEFVVTLPIRSGV